ncbi:MAG TPA: PssD/Cps14F family polysaccharide biosynthesis glycosyltransferase [Sedimentisphaerales bacterium]|nr:PssD/Cps14F family polysaccharide biosynthesis glycosyltransferase [Sedimentisphaerales bacterium]
MKICIVASAGGHLSQLLKIADCWRGHEIFCITTSELVVSELQRYGKVYTVPECNRRHPVEVAKVFADCVKTILCERPQVVISTGAAVGCIECILGYVTGAKIVWIDSIANVNALSLSGRIIRYIADVFIVQWPELAEKYRKTRFARIAV